MDTMIQDVRYALRVLVRNPMFAAIAILTMALGIGANSAIFTVVNAVLLRPLPFRDPSRLVIVAEKNAYGVISTSYQNWIDWRDQSRSYESMEATRAATVTLTGSGEPERLNLRNITAGAFNLLGVNALVGRTFTPEEDSPNGGAVAVLSYPLWQRRFGGSRDIIGKSIDLDSKPATVIGILPPAFQLLQPADVYVPFTPWAKTLPDDRNWHPGIIALARLKESVSREEANTEIATIAKRLEQQYPEYNTGKGAEIVGLQEQMVNNIRPALLLLLGAVGFVLLIACVNVANLLLARATTRGREVAIRTSMGANRGRIVRQLLTESVLIAVAGGGLGLLLASAGLGPLLKLSTGTLPAAFEVSLDRSVLVFTLVVSLATGVIFGLVPALRTAKFDVREALNEASRGSTSGPAQHRLRGLLVAIELALAMLLLVGSGLLLRSFARLQEVSPGFQTDHLLAADLPLSVNAYAKPEQRFQFFDRLVERVASLPGVLSAAATSTLPVSGLGGLLHFNIQGRPPKGPHEYTATGYRTVTANYFETLKIPLVKGRLLRAGDRENAPAVVIINSQMARDFFPDENPLGKRVQLGATPSPEKEAPYMEIVGVVGDTLQGLELGPKAEMYLPYRQADAVLPVFGMSIVLRTAGDPLQETSALRSALAEIDPNQPLINVRSMEQNIATSVAQPRFRTWLIGIFAALALLLAAVGVYGVMSYTVTQRTSEIGIRVTLGAQSADVFREIVGEGLRIALLGVTVGLFATLGLARLLRTFLYGVSASDPATMIGMAILLLLATALACFFPARRAMRVDPIVALRYE